MKKGKKRPEICLLLNCRTIEEIKEELRLFGEDCQAVQWNPGKHSGIESYTREEFIQMLKLVKTMCGKKQFIFQYYDVEDEETTNRMLRYAMGTADCIDINLQNSDVRTLLKEAKKIGIEEAYLSCLKTNIGSFRAQQKNGAVIRREDDLRFYTKIAL